MPTTPPPARPPARAADATARRDRPVPLAATTDRRNVPMHLFVSGGYEAVSALPRPGGCPRGRHHVSSSPRGPVDDKQLAKLIKRTTAKAEQAAKARRPRGYDPTLAATRPPDADEDAAVDRTAFFKEMKRREF